MTNLMGCRTRVESPYLFFITKRLRVNIKIKSNQLWYHLSLVSIKPRSLVQNHFSPPDVELHIYNIKKVKKRKGNQKKGVKLSFNFWLLEKHRTFKHRHCVKLKTNMF